eukprot:355320-Chlamydomonas_euryale.AAC.2
MARFHWVRCGRVFVCAVPWLVSIGSGVGGCLCVRFHGSYPLSPVWCARDSDAPAAPISREHPPFPARDLSAPSALEPPPSPCPPPRRRCAMRLSSTHSSSTRVLPSPAAPRIPPP